MKHYSYETQKRESVANANQLTAQKKSTKETDSFAEVDSLEIAGFSPPPFSFNADPIQQKAKGKSNNQVSSEPIQTKGEASPIQRNANATDQWAIKLGISGGGGHAGLGGAFAIGKLKNRETGQEADGEFVGGGIGVGLQTPGVDPGWGDWVDFRTDEAYTFNDFDGTLARLTSAGAGIGLIGYSMAWISFPMKGANSIYVGGFNMGAIGIDGGSNVGVWNVDGTPPA